MEMLDNCRVFDFPALSLEPFRYRGASKDGGTLEYVFEAGAEHSQCRNKRKRLRLHDHFLPRTGRLVRGSGI
jgi:hypothetical protein